MVRDLLKLVYVGMVMLISMVALRYLMTLIEPSSLLLMLMFYVLCIMAGAVFLKLCLVTVQLWLKEICDRKDLADWAAGYKAIKFGPPGGAPIGVKRSGAWKDGAVDAMETRAMVRELSKQEES